MAARTTAAVMGVTAGGVCECGFVTCVVAGDSSAAGDEYAKFISTLPKPPASEIETRARNKAVLDRMRAVLDADTFAHFRESAQRFRDDELGELLFVS